MDALPEGVLQHILSHLSNAGDVAACAAVSRRWRDCVPFLPSLHFPRGAFKNAGVAAAAADEAIGRMVAAAAARLKELVVLCPFSASSLLPRVLLASSLRVLELLVDSSSSSSAAAAEDLDSIGAVAAGLEELRLRVWGLRMTARAPAWGRMERLRVLEVIGAVLIEESAVVDGVVAACPNLTDLALLRCQCAGDQTVINISLPLLERCRLDLLVRSAGNCSLRFAAPRVESLEVQGFSWIYLQGGNHRRVKHLTISMNTGILYHVEIMGKLPELDHLSLRGIQWSWGAITSVLQCAAEVKHLVMKVEFCGDYGLLQHFPEIDLVDFFNSHPKLRKVEIHGAMFASLCGKDSLKKLDSRFAIPFLEQVHVTVRSPLNAEQKLNMLESLLRYSVRLSRMVIRISQMKDCHASAADDFFEKICKLTYMNSGKVSIE